MSALLVMADQAYLNDQLVMDSKQDLVDEIVRLRTELRGALCPGGGYTGQPADEYPTVDACLKAGVCGCSHGAALTPSPIHEGRK